MTAVNCSEMNISNNPVETLVAFSIGAGIGISVFDRACGVGGILNFMLPDSTRANGVDPEKVAPYFTAPRNAIVTFVDHIRKSYGSTSDYLMTKAGVNKKTLELLKKELLD